MKKSFTTHLRNDFHAWLPGGGHPEGNDGGMLGPRLGGPPDSGVCGRAGPRHGCSVGTGQQAERYCKCIAFGYVFFLATAKSNTPLNVMHKSMWYLILVV